MGGVFDLPATMTGMIESNFRNTETVSLKMCEELPELAPLKFGNDRGSFGGNRSGGRGGGGGRDRGNFLLFYCNFFNFILNLIDP